jgi:hypothetical protein
MPMRHIVMCDLPCSTIFFYISHKRHHFLKKKLLNIKCVLVFLQILSETFLILRIIQRDMIKQVYWYSCEVGLPVILGRFWWNLNFLGRFLKYNEMSSFRTIRPVVTELFRADGRTDRHMTKLIVAFRKFAKAPKSRKSVSCSQFGETFYACDLFP